MRFHHSPDVWNAHPSLVAGVVRVGGITNVPDVQDQLRPYAEVARQRLTEHPVSEFPEVQAWRRTFSAMGLKPTQYRCAAESILRRLDKDGEIPRIHPLVDLCNHISVSHAIPIAVFDLDHVTGNLEVRPANGTEHYTTFSGDIEQPVAGEVIFADDAGNAHARRWTNRQSAASAIRATTTDVLIVIEALHPNAGDDIRALIATLTDELVSTWRTEPESAMLAADGPGFPIAAG